MGKYETALLWVILILGGLLYSWTKKKRNEAAVREMTGSTAPAEEPRDNFLIEGLVAGLAAGWLIGYLGIAEKNLAMCFGVIVGFCAGLVIKKKPKNKDDKSEKGS